MAVQELFLVQIVLLPIACTLAKGTSCSMPPVSEGQTAFLKCNFHQDMAKSHHDILVLRYSRTPSVQDPVLSCSWLQDQEDYDCSPSAPFSLEGKVSDHLVLHLPNAQRSDEGTYYCQVTDNSFGFTVCNFTLSPASDADSSSSPDPGIFIGLSVVLVVALVVIICVVYCRCHRRRQPEKFTIHPVSRKNWLNHQTIRST